MLDSIHLERMGIPSVVVVTKPFVLAAKTNAQAQGMPQLRMVVVPHDYLVETEEQIEAKVALILDEILERLYLE